MSVVAAPLQKKLKKPIHICYLISKVVFSVIYLWLGVISNINIMNSDKNIKGVSLFYKHWHNQGVYTISDAMNTDG